ncbi:hypothetical protein CcI49_20325 [Frankia sp. CcI49]|uniref:hypothetical protein n=1 Tax=unclassified Frankia TaxID=2632575 RepID=UPI0006CA2D1E|nr:MULTISPECIES: hypothetical protein [unclassified Frankia]KPM54348.1 hypothetical protein ACG83_20630 [Frankia sp. R43]ONH58767.1 hypothetical protein CcI49_20325 [Frankia sp. CcI49]
MATDPSISFSGGLPAEREYFFPARPDNPQMRDSASFWIADDRGEIGLPRFGIEAVGANWDEHLVTFNLVFRDGRVYRLRGKGTPHSPFNAAGEPAILGAGGLAFEVIEPYRTWRVTYDGPAVATTSQRLIDGDQTGPTVNLRVEVSTTMAVPPWEQGALLTDAAALLHNTSDGDMMGHGPRIEQLFTAAGTVEVDGETHTFTGSGLRIKRQGVRHLEEFRGHAWQSAVFPSGKAFGYITYPPHPDGRPVFNEGYLYLGEGKLVPARVVEAPWLRRLVPAGDPVPVVFESELGITRIEGVTALTTHDTAFRPELPNFPVLFQGECRYTWDGEETYGMLERSTVRELIEWT